VLSLGTPFLEAVTGKAAAACSHYLFAGITPHVLPGKKMTGNVCSSFKKKKKKRDRHLTLFLPARAQKAMASDILPCLSLNR
jgi:hypothetical protein